MSEEKNVENETTETSMSFTPSHSETFDRLMKRMKGASEKLEKEESFKTGGVVTGSGSATVGTGGTVYVSPTTSSGAGMWHPTTWTTTTPSTLGPAGPGVTRTTKPVKPKQVALPTKVTEKFLIAILDPDSEDENDVLWAATLKLKSSSIQYDATDAGEITITLSLEDVYGNVKES